MELKIDENFRNLIMPLGTEEKALLRESIIQDGVRDALIAWNGILLDGHNRFEICEELGLPYSVKSIELEDETAAEEWILRNQLGRRNLTDVERVRLALKLKDKISKKAKANQGKRNDLLAKLPKSDIPQILGESLQNDQEEKVLAILPKPIDTRQEIAKLSGVSERTVAKVEAVDRTAPAPIKDAMDKVISIDRAYEINKEIHKLPEKKREEEARRLVEEATQKELNEVSRQRKVFDKIHDIICTPFKYYEFIKQENVDIYVRELSDCYTVEELIQNVDKSIEYLEKVKTYLQTNLQFRRVK